MKPNRASYPMHPETPLESGVSKLSCESVSTAAAPDTCGAKTRAGTPCKNLPMKNGRCRMHGGASTGRKTPEGIARWRAAVTLHGGRSQEMRELRALIRSLKADARRLVKMV